MYTLILTSSFKKQYRKLVKKNPQLVKHFNKVISQLELDPYYPGLSSHIIKDHYEFGDVMSSRVTGDIRILWEHDTDNRLVLILLRTGEHDFVY